MGLSSKKVKTTSNETATTTPNIYGPATGPAQDYYSNVGNFMELPASSLVTPANSLQTQAFGNAANLGGQNWDIALNNNLRAMNDLNGIGDIMPSYATIPTPYKAANVAGVTGPNVSQAALGTLRPVTQAGYQGYSAPTLGNASQVSLGGYNANQVGDVGQFLDNSVERVQGQSLLDNLPAYMNPYLRDVVDTSAADFDQYAAQQRAELARKGALAGGFGGSGYGLAMGQTEGELARGRGALLSGLRSDAFKTGAGLSADDANRRQQAGIFNAGSQNERDLARGQLGMQGALFNAGSLNDAAAFGANANNQGQMFNAGAQNDFGLRQADLNAQAAQFGAGAYNTAQLANAGAANQYGLAAFDAANQMGQFNAGQNNQAANLQYSNEAQAARQNAQSANDVASQIYGTTADLGKYNAGAFQDSQQFNTQTDLQRAIQQLAASGQYADILGQQGQQQIANTALQGDLGQQQWNIENQATQAPLIKLLADQGLLDPSLIAALSGQTITSSGSGTQKSSGGLLGQLLAAGSQLGSAAILASERRVKRDISLVGREDDGLGRYTFNYVWDASDEPLRHGVMADEVAELRPWALGPVIGGIQHVNYGAL